MKSLSSKSSLSRRRKIIIAGVILLLIGASVGAYFYNKQIQDEATKKEQESSDSSHSSKEDIINSKNSSNSSEGLPKNSSSTTSEQVPTSSSLSVNIASTSQTGGMVKASAQTSGSGTCVFLYQPADSGKPVTREINVTNNNCSLAISQNEFAYLGNWKLTVTYYSGGGKVEASQNVTIN